jgi:hypothetical protein
VVLTLFGASVAAAGSQRCNAGYTQAYLLAPRGARENLLLVASLIIGQRTKHWVSTRGAPRLPCSDSGSKLATEDGVALICASTMRAACPVHRIPTRPQGAPLPPTASVIRTWHAVTHAHLRCINMPAIHCKSLRNNDPLRTYTWCTRISQGHQGAAGGPCSPCLAGNYSTTPRNGNQHF